MVTVVDNSEGVGMSNTYTNVDEKRCAEIDAELMHLFAVKMACQIMADDPSRIREFMSSPAIASAVVAMMKEKA